MSKLLAIWPLLLAAVAFVGAIFFVDWHSRELELPIPETIERLAKRDSAIPLSIFYQAAPAAILVGGLFLGSYLIQLGSVYLAPYIGGVAANSTIGLIMFFLTVSLAGKMGRKAQFLERALRQKKRTERLK